MRAILPPKQLSDRVKRRFHSAARLLRTDGVKFHFPREQFHEQIQNVLEKLPAERHATRKAMVDWVEDYDLASEAQVMHHPVTRVRHPANRSEAPNVDVPRMDRLNSRLARCPPSRHPYPDQQHGIELLPDIDRPNSLPWFAVGENAAPLDLEAPRLAVARLRRVVPRLSGSRELEAEVERGFIFRDLASDAQGLTGQGAVPLRELCRLSQDGKNRISRHCPTVLAPRMHSTAGGHVRSPRLSKQ